MGIRAKQTNYSYNCLEVFFETFKNAFQHQIIHTATDCGMKGVRRRRVWTPEYLQHEKDIN